MKVEGAVRDVEIPYGGAREGRKDKPLCRATEAIQNQIGPTADGNAAGHRDGPATAELEAVKVSVPGPVTSIPLLPVMRELIVPAWHSS